MNEPTQSSRTPQAGFDRLYSAITTTSKYITFVAIVTMMSVMVIEVFMRYLVQQPLGWNISLIENILMPALVFLGLPYAYAVGAHVAAELVYDRLGPTSKRVLDWLSRILLVLCAVLLIYAGIQITVASFMTGELPPPLSSEIRVPAWIWRAFLPLGVLMMVILVIIDAVRPTKHNLRGAA